MTVTECFHATTASFRTDAAVPHRFSLCVYCGSSPGDSPLYAEAAVAVGTWIARQGGRLVYGGGRNGLMGTVADACLCAGGSVLGVIPAMMKEREWAHTGCTDLVVVDTMTQRKMLMIENSDAVIALPGGLGTLEELFEAWTLSSLGFTNKPVGLLNVNGYFDPLHKMFETALAAGFMKPDQLRNFRSGRVAPVLCEELLQLAEIA